MPRIFTDSVDDSNEVNGICSYCSNSLFSEFCKDLVAAKSDPSYMKRYSRKATDLYQSMTEGCRWCSCVGNAMLTSADLDYWMNDWYGSHSDGDSLLSIPTSPQGEVVADNPMDEDALEEVDNTDTISDNEDPERPGFLTMKSLNSTADINIDISVLKCEGSDVFNLIKVNAELISGEDDDSIIPDLMGEDKVVITMEPVSEGKISTYR